MPWGRRRGSARPAATRPYGTFFGVDFNPAADRLRIISNTGQNLRHNVNAGGVTLSDTALNYTAGTPTSGLTGAAYTNNDLDPATGTTLFDVDTNLNQIGLLRRTPHGLHHVEIRRAAPATSSTRPSTTRTGSAVISRRPGLAVL